MANPRPAGDRDLIARDHVFHPYTSTEQQRAVLPVAG